MSEDRNITKLCKIDCKIPPIWIKMADDDGNVNSNYGYQWQRKRQLNQMILKLKLDKDTRQACISIYDGKEHHKYGNETTCTYAVRFTIVNDKLDMCVRMSSNDIWNGFCNDQYQCTMLKK